MIADLLNLAMGGDPGTARDQARGLSDPGLLPEFAALLGGRLRAVERRLIYEFLDYLARNARVPEVTAFVGSRLKSETAEDTQLMILGTLRLLDGVDCGPVEACLQSPKPRVRQAAVEALGACAGPRPRALLGELLSSAEGVADTMAAALALARVGDAASAEVAMTVVDRLEWSQATAVARVHAMVAAVTLCGTQHRDWLRGRLAVAGDDVERWLLVLGLSRVGTAEDCALVAGEVERYLLRPTGPIRLMTGRVQMAHPTLFQAGLAFLRATCPERFAVLAARAAKVYLPEEDRAYLAA